MSNSFQFTPNGITNIGASDDCFDILPANPDLFRRPDTAVASIPTEKQPRVPRIVAAPSKPVDVLKLAKKSLREMNREIARLAKLIKARDELQRLVDAAEQKPRAIVRDIAAKRG